jgi:hypothetical protein
MVDESQLDGQSSYAGRWIARIGGQIVGHGGTPEQALNSAQASRFKEIPQVYFVTHSDQITFHPIIEKLAKILPTDPPIYLVGGAIRNKLTNRDNIEFDFTLPGKAIPTASLTGHFISWIRSVILDAQLFPILLANQSHWIFHPFKVVPSKMI